MKNGINIIINLDAGERENMIYREIDIKKCRYRSFNKFIICYSTPRPRQILPFYSNRLRKREYSPTVNCFR
jgi:hypothetical protein